jgi:hypothetical protein
MRSESATRAHFVRKAGSRLLRFLPIEAAQNSLGEGWKIEPILSSSLRTMRTAQRQNRNCSQTTCSRLDYGTLARIMKMLYNRSWQ